MSSSRRRMATSVANVMFTNAVYFPNYKIYSGASPGMLNYGCISHVFYAFASVAVDGSVFVILSVGGGNSSEVFPVLASDALLRDNFGRSARGLVEASGFDGIDICWEYPSDVQQGADFVALLDATRVHLPADEYFLTAALPASQSILQCIDIRTAAHYLDMVNLMAYDFYGSWTHRSGHHSQLYAMNKDEPSGTSGIAFLIGAGCPAKKINLGIPLYGRSFLGVSGPGHRFKAVGGEDGTFDYNQLPRKGAKEQVDKRIGAAMCVGGDGGFVTYDNPDTVKMKATYCKQKGLGNTLLTI
ncbi:hypothetical protein G7054_g3894 [Neopestalotiopsis clavispora]|nr:hypothetical protein G7054_g3894 [Neopestalotiopsis clavispora]